MGFGDAVGKPKKAFKGEGAAQKKMKEKGGSNEILT